MSPEAHFPRRGSRPDARRPRLYESLVEDAFDFTVTIRADFSVGFVSQGVVDRLGRPADRYVGCSVADFVHPDDLERALLHMGGWSNGVAPGGTTTFRLQHADGHFLPFDVTAARVTDGDEEFLAVYARPVDYQIATDEVLAQLLGGGSKADALRPVLDVFSWEVNDSSIAIAWYEPEVGHRQVSTGLPLELTGASDEPPEAWARARATGEPVLDLDRSLLDPELDDLAASLRKGGYWVVPVPDAGSDVPALITVWSNPEVGRPDGHAYGMSMAATYTELILRWSQHVRALEAAARQDPLTGLANRKALFDSLESSGARGALLFCDLDHFKPVNDRYGHAAGDEVLRQIGRRLEGAVRTGDIVARTGGDEFVILAPDISLEQAAALAQRVRTAVAQPTAVPGGGSVSVGVTIGVAHAADAVSESTLAGADQALMLAKANARGTVRWAPGPMPEAPDTPVAPVDTPVDGAEAAPHPRAGDADDGSGSGSLSPDTSTE